MAKSGNHAVVSAVKLETAEAEVGTGSEPVQIYREILNQIINMVALAKEADGID
jgi:hypothetical protein